MQRDLLPSRPTTFCLAVKYSDILKISPMLLRLNFQPTGVYFDLPLVMLDELRCGLSWHQTFEERFDPGTDY